MGSRLGAALALAAALCACSRKPLEVPALKDAPVVEAARIGEVRLTAPGYGIALARGGGVQFEVNLEAEDAPLVREGDPCVAYSPPSTATVSCVVSRVARGVSEETGQALAWLAPKGAERWPAGEFIFAMITTRTERHALVVPPSAVLTKDGKTWVVVKRAAKDGSASYEPAQVVAGAAADGEVEIEKGLSPGDQVVVQGGIGFLYPEFKAASD